MKYGRTFLFILAGALMFLAIGVDPFPKNTSCYSFVGEENLDGQLKALMSQATLYQNVTRNGDIVIENGTYIIENMEFHLNGKITARNDAAVIARNAKLVFTPRDEVVYQGSAILYDRSKFIAENATIILQPASARWVAPYDVPYIAVNDEAFVNLTDSKFSGWGYVVAKNNSSVYTRGMIMRGEDPANFKECGVSTNDNAIAHIQNSTLDAAISDSTLFIQASHLARVANSAKSTFEIKDSNIGGIDGGSGNVWSSSMTEVGGIGGNCTVKIHDSKISGHLSTYASSTVWLFGSSVNRVRAFDSSTVWAINTWTNQIHTLDKGVVLAGLSLPLFGLVTVSYTWVPFIISSAVVLILIAIVIVGACWQMHKLPHYKDPLWALGIVLVVVSCLLPWGSGWIFSSGYREGEYLVWFLNTPAFAFLAVLIGLITSFFGIYYLPVEFALEDTAFQGITALVSGFLVTYGALQWILTPNISISSVPLSSPVHPFDATILYGAYLALVAGILIMIVGTDPLIKSGRNYLGMKNRK